MEDNTKLVTVHIAVGWLRERAARDRKRIDNPVLLFNFYRDEVEAAASAKYDGGHCEGADVVVTAKDMLRASKRRSSKLEAVNGNLASST
jgi:hypothetical protein